MSPLQHQKVTTRLRSSFHRSMSTHGRPNSSHSQAGRLGMVGNRLGAVSGHRITNCGTFPIESKTGLTIWPGCKLQYLTRESRIRKASRWNRIHYKRLIDVIADVPSVQGHGTDGIAIADTRLDNAQSLGVQCLNKVLQRPMLILEKQLDSKIENHQGHSGKRHVDSSSRSIMIIAATRVVGPSCSPLRSFKHQLISAVFDA